MSNLNQSDFPRVKFGENVKIIAKNVIIEPGVTIGDNCTIIADDIFIGFDTIIEHDVSIKAIGGTMEKLYLGDNCFIGFRNQILVPIFIMKDFSQLHNSGLHSGYKSLEIGYNCWIGQNSILNSTEQLIIKNNVRIGTGSQLWTHVASGELFEGCTLYGNKSLVLEDDVWIVGGAVISPGLILKKKSIIMTGSVLTKNTEEKHTYAGVPAKDVTEKLSFWKEFNYTEKLETLNGFITDFLNFYPQYIGKLQIVSNSDEESISDGLIFIDRIPAETQQSNTYFSLEDKTYTKKRSKIEIDWIKFCVGFRMRFIPV